MTNLDSSGDGNMVAFMRRHAAFFIIVVLPTLLAAFYYSCIATGQYESEAVFIVKDSRPSRSSGGAGMGMMAGMGMAAAGSGLAEGFAVNTYMKSHDAVAALQKRLDLVSIFRRPGTDFISRLFWASPPPEKLLKYYLRHVDVIFHEDTGVTSLAVRAFRPDDAEQITRTLLQLGEQRINDFNARVSKNTISVADDEVAEAEQRVRKVQQRLTAFRQKTGDLDPQKSSVAGISLIAQLQTELAQADTQLSQMLRYIDPASPQVQTIKERIHALDQQIEQQRDMVGNKKQIALNISDYDEMMMEREFAQINYNATATELQVARAEALRQQVYIVRVVEPNMPSIPTYPHGVLMVVAVFVGGMVTLLIGRLLITGIKEHAI
ncbi:hypothetical protein [Komagataeibacter sp. FNDCR2]|uniref:hypothetical protein n=1 Tax=Komagataeibacter sp. FNDCR2 TaxID=2878682 RepID=UPI001E47BCF8|nr:hypothetical protein [Komagataeibacter sp. FNDCR2]MCE2575618.1 hypothetical protein [Komagataeibacter sp. FNDCR2]